MDNRTENELFTWLQFVKVTVTHDGQQSNVSQSGHLTALSCRMLVVELERHGFQIVRASRDYQ